MSGYQYSANLYCGGCVLAALGIETIPGPGPVDVEAMLDDLADTKNIDREDESSYDSDTFPKHVPDDTGEICAQCGDYL